MYVIVDAVYGVPVNQKMWDLLDAQGIDPDTLASQGLGAFPYSGAGDMPPGYIGVKLDTFEEVGDYENGMERSVKVSNLALTPSPAQVQTAKDNIAKLIEEVPDIEPLLPPVDTYFVFSTS